MLTNELMDKFTEFHIKVNEIIATYRYKQVFVLISHQLLPEQKQELQNRFGNNSNGTTTIIELRYLPENLQQIWSNVLYDDKYYTNLNEIIDYVFSILNKGDYVIVQGNWGYTYKLIEEAKKHNIIPLYAFSVRDSSEEIINGEVVKTTTFRHQCFVEY